MAWDGFCQVVGDTARPISTLALAGGIIGGVFAHADAAALTIESTCFLALIGARATENIFQTKAAVATTASATNSQGAKP